MLPTCLEWLIAAGNQIAELPNIDRLQKVRKLMLSHNRLTCEALAPVAQMPSLEMIRAAANALEAFPKALLKHPRLAWLALGGNPFAEKTLTRHLAEGTEELGLHRASLGREVGKRCRGDSARGNLARPEGCCEDLGFGVLLGWNSADRMGRQPRGFATRPPMLGGCFGCLGAFSIRYR